MPNAEPTPPTQELPIPASASRPDAPRPSRSPQTPPPHRRFDALAAAVRAHRVVTGHSSIAMRPSDHALYRRLAEIEASPPIPGEDA
jgi:hypothetical protein